MTPQFAVQPVGRERGHRFESAKSKAQDHAQSYPFAALNCARDAFPPQPHTPIQPFEAKNTTVIPRLFPFVLACCICLTCLPTIGADEVSNTVALGVSLAGAEFGVESDTFSNENPGKLGIQYTFPTEKTVEYFARNGVWMMRIPIRWERIQPNLNGELDPAHIDALRSAARTARKNGSLIILDIHNYGRYRKVVDGTPRTFVIDETIDGEVHVSRDHFADLWRRLAVEFRAERGVTAYGLMNEPHDMGHSDWKEISQAGVDAIRKIDKKTTLLIAGDHWSNAHGFTKHNGKKAWIKDPANRSVYEAHCYFDQEASGKYGRPYIEEEKLDANVVNRGVERIQPFLDWCKTNQVCGFIGEFGTPSDAGWQEVTNRFLAACGETNTPVCYWAAGEWWGNYPLSIQPRKGKSESIAPQMKWMLDMAK